MLKKENTNDKSKYGKKNHTKTEKTYKKRVLANIESVSDSDYFFCLWLKFCS